MAEGIILFDNIIGNKGDIFDVKGDLFDYELSYYIFLLNFVSLNIFGSGYFGRFIIKLIKYKCKCRGFVNLRLPLFFGRMRYYKIAMRYSII